MEINNINIMNKLIRIALLLALMLSGMVAAAQSPQSIPDPNRGDPGNFIYDPMGLLSAGTADEVNHKIAALRKNNGCELAVAIVSNLDGLDVNDYAYQLFRHWGVGMKDKNNGVLLLVAPNERQARIEVGSNLEGILTDVACSNILRHYMRPAVKSENMSQGVSNAVGAISDALSDEAVAKELAAPGDGLRDRIRMLDSNVLMSFVVIIAVCFFIFALILWIVDFVNSRGRDNYRRAMVWRTHLATYWWCAALSLGTALPIALIAWLFYRHARDVKEICDTCGAKMNKLSEEEDNNYLTPSQDFEEKLGTVDYDVWLCPECGTVERFPYVEKQLKYSECPNCHVIAMNLVMDKVVTPPTTKSAGLGERLYQCQYCGHKKREQYRIPRKNDDGAAGALLAGAALGAMASRGGGGGGFSGGGFGGGHSSGGGASIGW